MDWRSLPRKVADFPAKHRLWVWLLLALIGVATIGPIGLRPTTPLGPDGERFAAFMVVGCLFGLAYPGRQRLVGVLLLFVCALLEYAQHFVPGRHPDFGNFMVKAAGALAGMFAGKLLR